MKNLGKEEEQANSSGAIFRGQKANWSKMKEFIHYMFPLRKHYTKYL